MKIRVPEPVGKPVELFRLYFKDRRFTKSGFSDLVDKCEFNLDNVCDRIRTGEFSLIDYDLTFYSISGERIGGLVKGGGLVSEEFVERVIGDLQDRYKNSFLKAREEYLENALVDADMYVVAFRDTVSIKVEARNPY